MLSLLSLLSSKSNPLVFLKPKKSYKTNMSAVINVSVLFAVVIMQLDSLFVCYKVTDWIQNKNTDLYKRYQGPYSLFKKKRLVLNSIWFTKEDRNKLSPECERLFLRQRIDFIGSAICVVLWIIFILIFKF